MLEAMMMGGTCDAHFGWSLGEQQEVAAAVNIASLPMRMGGLGLRRATRMAQAAYWASSADALQMVDQRLPEVANRVINRLAKALPNAEPTWLAILCFFF